MHNLIAPLNPPYAEDIQAILANYPQRGGYLLTLFRTFANSKRFLLKGVPNLLDNESPLTLRQREIVILRVTANLDCEYEWGVHVAAFARAAGFTENQLEATRTQMPSAPCWSESEALLLRLVDELSETATLTGATREAFARNFTREQQLEVLALCGAYHTVSFVANAARLEGEPFGAKFPARM
ncbi:MAG: carboxymuconolactone decarboxylase family protein [Alphaproteobacteria bacterium]|nr:carboxymuconolactone decarboxylase family protein [Alphaproteobacteria bacterium]